MTQEENQQPAEYNAETEWRTSNSLDALRNAGCKCINQYLPGYTEGADQAEVFGITQAQFDRAFDLEWIRRGRPNNSVVASLYHENDRLRGELSKVGLYLDAAVLGRTRQDEPRNLTPRLDRIRVLAHRLTELKDLKDRGDESVLVA